MKEKVLLDTDIGTDIDDAVCLAYLLAHPECDLLGITTVTGEAERRAMLASAVCSACGRDVPIYPGAEIPLFLPQRQERAQQAEVLERWVHAKSFPRGEAIEFLRKTIRRHPGEITLLAVAPLTNIALLFSVDPEIPSLLKRLVMMCGRFFDPPPSGYGIAEWNALVDAHATHVVYRARIQTHRSVGLDVTSMVRMDAATFRHRFADILEFRLVLEMAEVWFREWDGTTFHDPLAAATIFEEAICTYQRGNVDLDLAEGKNQGRTLWSPNGQGMHQIAATVDPDRFFSHLTSILLRKGIA